MTFEVAGGKPAAFRVLNALRLIAISNNLGDAAQPGHASRHHHAYAHRRRGARASGHYRRRDPPVRRAGGCAATCAPTSGGLDARWRGPRNCPLTGRQPECCSQGQRMASGAQAYEARTRDILVRVSPFYLEDQSEPEEGRYRLGLPRGGGKPRRRNRAVAAPHLANHRRAAANRSTCMAKAWWASSPCWAPARRSNTPPAPRCHAIRLHARRLPHGGSSPPARRSTSQSPASAWTAPTPTAGCTRTTRGALPTRLPAFPKSTRPRWQHQAAVHRAEADQRQAETQERQHAPKTRQIRHVDQKHFAAH